MNAYITINIGKKIYPGKMGCGSTKKRSDISDPTGKDKSKKGPGIYLIRNAPSVYDYWSKTYSSRAKRMQEGAAVTPDPDYKFLEHVESKFDIKLLDPGLQKQGVKEAEAAREKISKLNVKFVIVSPLKRALETSRKMLEGIKGKENIKIFVHPLLRPILSNSKDIPYKTISELKKEYESIPDLKYDFTLLNEGTTGDDTFFFESLSIPEKEKILEDIGKLPNKADYPKVLLDAAIEKKKTAKKGLKKLETYESMRRRAVRFGEFITSFVSKAGLKPEDDILIFTHGGVITYCNSVFWGPDGRAMAPKNERCTPIEFDYGQLLELEKQFRSSRSLRTGLTAQLMPGGTLKGEEDKSIFVVPLQTCAKGHQLFFSRSVDKGQDYDCVKCLKGGKTTEGRWNCLFCKYDLCGGCKGAPAADATKKLCLNGHTLAEEEVNEDMLAKFVCAKCKKEGTTASGKKRLCCVGCSYDLCPGCV